MYQNTVTTKDRPLWLGTVYCKIEATHFYSKNYSLAHGILKYMRNVFAVFIFLFLSAMPCLGSAQVTSAALEFSPELPNAQEVFTVKLSGVSDPRASISWMVNNVRDNSFSNQNTITVTAGNVGVTTAITAVVTLPDKTSFEVTQKIIPNRIDIVIESDTVVPPFYGSRALPSSGSAMRATALVFTKKQSPGSAFTYTWSIGGTVQNGGRGSGNTLSFSTGFEKEVAVSVTVHDTQGNIVGRTSRIVAIAEPELHFYEKNPLRGLSLVAMTNPYIFIGDELNVRAEGYFMGKNLFGQDALREWKVDGQKVAPSELDQQELLLQKQGDTGGMSKISFHLRNVKQLLQGAEKTLTIKF